MRGRAVVGVVVREIRERKVMHHNTIGHRTRAAAFEFDGRTQIGHIADGQLRHRRTAPVVEPAELAGAEQSPRAHTGQSGDVTEIPCAGEMFVPRTVHPFVTAAAIGLGSRPSSTLAMVRKCTSSGPSKSRMARCQLYIRASGKSSLTPAPPCT